MTYVRPGPRLARLHGCLRGHGPRRGDHPHIRRDSIPARLAQPAPGHPRCMAGGNRGRPVLLSPRPLQGQVDYTRMARPRKKSLRFLALVGRYRVPAIIGFVSFTDCGWPRLSPSACRGCRFCTFVALNAVSGLVWAAIFGIGGYFLGAALGAIISNTAARLIVGALMIALCVAIAALCIRVRARAEKP